MDGQCNCPSIVTPLACGYRGHVNNTPTLLVAQHAIRQQLVHTRQQRRGHLQAPLTPPLHNALLQPRHHCLNSRCTSRCKHACTLKFLLQSQHSAADEPKHQATSSYFVYYERLTTEKECDSGQILVYLGVLGAPLWSKKPWNSAGSLK